MTYLAYADDIVILSSSYSKMQGLLEAVNRHAAAVGMCINASKTKVMSALIPGEHRQAVLLGGEPLEDADKFKYLGSMLVANGQGTEGIRSRVNLARSVSLTCNPILVVARNTVAYKGRGLLGSSVLNFTLRLRDVACTNSRRKDVGGL